MRPTVCTYAYELNAIVVEIVRGTGVMCGYSLCATRSLSVGCGDAAACDVIREWIRNAFECAVTVTMRNIWECWCRSQWIYRVIESYWNSIEFQFLAAWLRHWSWNRIECSLKPALSKWTKHFYECDWDWLMTEDEYLVLSCRCCLQKGPMGSNCRCFDANIHTIRPVLFNGRIRLSQYCFRYFPR